MSKNESILKNSAVAITLAAICQILWGIVFPLIKKAYILFNINSAERLPDFSGYIAYSFEVELTGDGPVALDLGEVGQIAQLQCNGQDLGWRYCRPFRFEIPAKFLQKGKNQFRVVVANTLANALKDAEFSFFLQIPRSGLFGPLTLWE